MAKIKSKMWGTPYTQSFVYNKQQVLMPTPVLRRQIAVAPPNSIFMPTPPGIFAGLVGAGVGAVAALPILPPYGPIVGGATGAFVGYKLGDTLQELAKWALPIAPIVGGAVLVFKENPADDVQTYKMKRGLGIGLMALGGLWLGGTVVMNFLSKGVAGNCTPIGGVPSRLKCCPGTVAKKSLFHPITGTCQSVSLI